jgi:chromosome segregation ATPase
VVEHAVHRNEYREVLSRLDILEHDVADVKVSIADLHRTMDERFDRMNERFDQMST